jgi:MFS family permease
VPRPRERLWTLPYVLLLFSAHFQFAAFFMVNLTLPLYLENARAWEIGIVVGAMGAIAIVLRPFTGRWADREGRRPLLLLGAATLVVAFAAYAITDEAIPLIGVRILHGAGMTVYTTASLTLVADLAPPKRRGEAVGFLNMGNNLTQVYAPLIAFAIATQWGFTPLFAIAVGSAVVSLVGAQAVHDPIPRHKRTDSHGLLSPPPPGALISRSAIPPSAVFLPVTITMASIWAFLPLFARDRDLGDPGLFFTLFGLTLVLVRPLAGLGSDRWGRALVIVPGLALSALSMAFLSMAQGQAAFLGVAVLFGVAFAMGHTGLLALTVDRSTVAERGVAMATFALTWDIGATVGPIVLGVVAGASSYATVYMIGAILIGAGLLSYLALPRATRPAVAQAMVEDSPQSAS